MTKDKTICARNFATNIIHRITDTLARPDNVEKRHLLTELVFIIRIRENGILIASGGRKNVPFQQYINAGYFTVKEVVLDDEDGYQIRLTPQLTGKGQQWLTRKLLDAGLLKPVAAE